MTRARFTEIIAVAALAASLAGLTACGSKTSKSAPAASASANQAASTSPSTTPTPSTSSSTSPSTTTIAALLASFGPGDVTVDHMPTADPLWVARVQTENQQHDSPYRATDPKLLNLMALVDEAAREKDTTALARLCTKNCDAHQQAALWAKPGVLDQLSSLIEHAPMGQGTLLPDFLLAKTDTSFGSADDTTYGKLVSTASPAAYFANGGIWTQFQFGTGGTDVAQQHWTGIDNQ